MTFAQVKAATGFAIPTIELRTGPVRFTLSNALIPLERRDPARPLRRIKAAAFAATTIVFNDTRPGTPAAQET
ncbi:MAG: hypothetical protein IPM02_07685 [Betaproteobacteria bacterium]|nr:hypothetical protein [Betaproteobacteria bacterium]